MHEPESKSILITFSETGEPEIFLNAATDGETALLQEWLQSSLKCGRPAGLSGGVLTTPGPPSLLIRDDHDLGKVFP